MLYGTNAYTGAINIVLRCQPYENALSGTAYAGVGIKQAMLAGGNVMLADDDPLLFVGGGGTTSRAISASGPTSAEAWR